MSGSTGLSPLQNYVVYTANEAKYAAATTAANPQHAALIRYFQANAAHITSPDALLKDYKALSVVLGAFRLSDQVNSTALLRKLLTQDPTSTSSVAHRTGNAKFIAFAIALNSWNPPPFATKDGVNAIVSAYKINQFETHADTQSAGLQKALYFTRTAPGITSLTQLQSDADLLAVAVTGLGLPLTAYDSLDFKQQTALLKQKLNINDLKKPAYVTHLAELYLVQQQINTGTNVPAVQPGTTVSLFSGTAGNANGGNALLNILQTASTGTGTTSLLGTTVTANNPLLSLFA